MYWNLLLIVYSDVLLLLSWNWLLVFYWNLLLSRSGRVDNGEVPGKTDGELNQRDAGSRTPTPAGSCVAGSCTRYHRLPPNTRFSQSVLFLPKEFDMGVGVGGGAGSI